MLAFDRLACSSRTWTRDRDCRWNRCLEAATKRVILLAIYQQKPSSESMESGMPSLASRRQFRLRRSVARDHIGAR